MFGHQIDHSAARCDETETATPAGDNLAIHHAIYAAGPGDVLVVMTGDHAAQWGYWGEIMSHAARTRGLAGLILQGGSRDHATLPAIGFPVFSLGACIRGTVKNATDAAHAIDRPVRIGDIDIEPGDLIVADIDGVVAIPTALAVNAVTDGVRRERHEAEVIARLQSGATTLDIYDLH